MMFPDVLTEKVTEPLPPETTSAHTPVTDEPNTLPKNTLLRDVPATHQRQLPFCLKMYLLAPSDHLPVRFSRLGDTEDEQATDSAGPAPPCPTTTSAMRALAIST
jgi:hypothetical protein